MTNPAVTRPSVPRGLGELASRGFLQERRGCAVREAGLAELAKGVVARQDKQRRERSSLVGARPEAAGAAQVPYEALELAAAVHALPVDEGRW
jgi:hypothetical protein